MRARIARPSGRRRARGEVAITQRGRAPSRPNPTADLTGVRRSILPCPQLLRGDDRSSPLSILLIASVVATLLMLLSTAAPGRRPDPLQRAQQGPPRPARRDQPDRRPVPLRRRRPAGLRLLRPDACSPTGRAGLYLPRSSDDQARFARHILRKNMRRGDLMFFTSGGHVYHVGIFLGRQHGARCCCTRRAPASVCTASASGPTNGSPEPCATADSGHRNCVKRA